MNQNKWLIEITPEKKHIGFQLKEVLKYKDLLILLVRRDIVAIYKQTILGPIWLVLQPLFTSIIQFFIFGKIATIPSDGAPYFLFVLTGNTLWSYFSNTLISIGNTFRTNEGIFSKVYFPRAVMPISIALSNLFQFIIQFLVLIFTLFLSYFRGWFIGTNIFVFFIPLIIFILALISLGFGMIISAITTKYKDFTFILGFGVNLLMYITPVVYPTSLFLENIPTNYHWMIYLNPLTGLFDLYKYAILGTGYPNYLSILWSISFALIIFFTGLLIFNKSERNFVDTI